MYSHKTFKTILRDEVKRIQVRKSMFVFIINEISNFKNKRNFFKGSIWKCAYKKLDSKCAYGDREQHVTNSKTTVCSFSGKLLCSTLHFEKCNVVSSALQKQSVICREHRRYL